MSFALTRKTDYALVALAVLAKEAAGEGQPLSARQIAQRHDLPQALLMNVLKDLHKAGVVCSRRGAGGGYLLCRQPEQISLLQIIEGIEGPVNVALCCEDPDSEGDPASEPCPSCRVLATCPITSPMQRVNELTRRFLSQLTLKDLTHQPTGDGHHADPVEMTLEGAQR